MSVNRFIGLGRLTKDVTLNSTNSGTSVANFSMALNEKYKDKKTEQWAEKTEFVNIVAWGPLGETASTYLSKGSECYLEGKLQTRSYDDKEGNKKYVTEIVANSIQFIGGRGEAKTETNPRPSGNDFAADDIPF